MAQVWGIPVSALNVTRTPTLLEEWSGLGSTGACDIWKSGQGYEALGHVIYPGAAYDVSQWHVMHHGVYMLYHGAGPCYVYVLAAYVLASDPPDIGRSLS